MKLSIILVSYRSQSDLSRCLPSIFSQKTREPFEVIVVDNLSGDGTALWLAETFPQVQVISNRENTGYAGGNNLGVQHSTGEWILILNPDTVLHDGVLATLMDVGKRHPNALINPKLLDKEGRVNACGLEMHYTGITTCRGYGAKSECYVGTHSVPFASGAALLLRKAVFCQLGSFDEHYFMYLEDIDLSMRARLQGFEIVCAADSVVTHYYSLGMSPIKYYYLERNRLASIIKLYQRSTFCRTAPGLFLTEWATWSFAFINGLAYCKAKIQAYAWVWQNQKRLHQERAVVQENRVVPDRIALKWCKTHLHFEQLLANQRVAQLLKLLTQPLYTIVQPFHFETKAES